MASTLIQTTYCDTIPEFKQKVAEVEASTESRYTWDGAELIHGYHQRCARSEKAYAVMKNVLAVGKPSSSDFVGLSGLTFIVNSWLFRVNSWLNNLLNREIL